MGQVVVAVIPARAGSRGIPGKNRRKVAGKPLWEWSLAAAQESTRVNWTLVTSDDSVILAVAAARHVPAIMRPPHLATDEATLDAAILHALDAADIADEALVVTLQPTVPKRAAGLVDQCVATFEFFPVAKALVTVNSLHFVWDQGGQLLNGPRSNRQDLDRRLYHEDGAVFVCRAGAMRASGTRVMDPVILLETPRTVDVDTEEDLHLAEFLLARSPNVAKKPHHLT